MEGLERPAPIQVSEANLHEIGLDRQQEKQHELGESAVFNVWHRKWAGGEKAQSRYRSPFRCNPLKDSGKTAAKSPFFCLWFARGCCHKGSECTFLHRTPNKDDAEILKKINTRDCFGRLKFAHSRDDMSGVGSFLEPCKTLHVGYFKSKKLSKQKLLTLVKNQFSVWGKVISVRLVKNLTCAFVTYEDVCNAEFAKEAMSNQTITGEEIITVRWAHSKPNENQDEISRIRSIVKTSLLEKQQVDKPAGEHGIEKPIQSDSVVKSQNVSREDKTQSEDESDKSSAEPKTQNTPPPAKKRRGLVNYD